MAEKTKNEPDLNLQVNRHEPVKIDDKGRISLQKEIRDALGSDVVLVGHISKVIQIYPTSIFSKIQADTRRRFSPENTNASYYFQALFSNARQTDVDAANRLTIPADLRKFAGMQLKQECVVIASGRDFLIMSGSAYEVYLDSPAKFMASQREDMEVLRKKAFEEEEELRRLERLLGSSE